MRRLIVSAVLVVGSSGCTGGDAPTPAPPTLSISSPAPATPATKDAPELAAARQFLEKGELQRALKSVTKVIDSRKASATAYETRAAVLQKLGRVDDAIADFSRAIEQQPGSARLHNNRGFLHLSLQDFDRALADFDLAIRRDATYANAHNNRGLLQIAQGRYRQAILDLDQAIGSNPNYVDAYNNRGFALMQLGRWDRALADFNRALQLDPRYVNAIANRGLVKQNLGDIAGAVLDYTDAMMIDPDNPKYYMHRREAYLSQGESKKAQADADKIRFLADLQKYSAEIAKHPESARPLVERAVRFAERGDEQRAWDDLSKAVQLAPDDADVRVQRASLALKMKQYPVAIEDCDHVLASAPDQRAFSIRGDCRWALKDLDGALQDLEAAQRLDATLAELYLAKGAQLEKLGQSEAAQQYVARAAAVDPEVGQQTR